MSWLHIKTNVQQQFFCAGSHSSMIDIRLLVYIGLLFKKENIQVLSNTQAVRGRRRISLSQLPQQRCKPLWVQPKMHRPLVTLIVRLQIRHLDSAKNQHFSKASPDKLCALRWYSWSKSKCHQNSDLSTWMRLDEGELHSLMQWVATLDARLAKIQTSVLPCRNISCLCMHDRVLAVQSSYIMHVECMLQFSAAPQTQVPCSKRHLVGWFFLRVWVPRICFQ